VAAALASVVLGAGASVFAQQAKQPAKAKPAAEHAIDESLPVLGTQLAELPPGPGKATADNGCLKCHSADILRQQRLNEKQWGASVTKMVGWGAAVPDDKKSELVAYLVKNFGPENTWQPVTTRPMGR